MECEDSESEEKNESSNTSEYYNISNNTAPMHCDFPKDLKDLNNTTKNLTKIDEFDMHKKSLITIGEFDMYNTKFKHHFADSEAKVAYATFNLALL